MILYWSAEGNQGKTKYARVVELVDSLDSGSSVHCGRAGSSPASRTKRNGYPKGYPFSFSFRRRDLKGRPEQSEGKQVSGGHLLSPWESPWIPGYTR